ncbi:cytidylate kinase [bacterium BMS3Abin05]|nr:cytidylate kinase [bacterium BMS3Abin05]GBE26196.1 cytidylate kinase [bacterium BMS3Bbin03]
MNRKRQSKHLIVAIDGPAGSGKSTTAKELARKLGYLYLDTGAMYRAFALKVLQEKIDPDDETALNRLAEQTQILLRPDAGGICVFLDGKDVTDKIRTPEIDRLVSRVSRVKAVRDRMVELQREIGKNGGIVAEGRDIGTVVFPQADVKIFLVASPLERAKRRLKDLRAGGIRISLEKVLADIEQRDEIDSNRKISPLKKAEDAVEIDTTNLSIEAQGEEIYNIIKQKGLHFR